MQRSVHNACKCMCVHAPHVMQAIIQRHLKRKGSFGGMQSQLFAKSVGAEDISTVFSEFLVLFRKKCWCRGHFDCIFTRFPILKSVSTHCIARLHALRWKAPRTALESPTQMARTACRCAVRAWLLFVQNHAESMHRHAEPRKTTHRPGGRGGRAGQGRQRTAG
jgi:hypothetical protein